MSAHTRAARREREAAKELGTVRVHRSRFESAPDVRPVLLACGLTLQPEVKTRARLPALLRQALAAARRYLPDAVPVAVVSESGGEAIACLPLRAFAVIAGIREPANTQTVLPLGPVKGGDDE